MTEPVSTSQKDSCLNYEIIECDLPQKECNDRVDELKDKIYRIHDQLEVFNTDEISKDKIRHQLMPPLVILLTNTYKHQVDAIENFKKRDFIVKYPDHIKEFEVIENVYLKIQELAALETYFSHYMKFIMSFPSQKTFEHMEIAQDVGKLDGSDTPLNGTPEFQRQAETHVAKIRSIYEFYKNLGKKIVEEATNECQKQIEMLDEKEKERVRPMIKNLNQKLFNAASIDWAVWSAFANTIKNAESEEQGKHAKVVIDP